MNLKAMLTALLLAAAVMVAGCASIPTSGAVEEVPMSTQPLGIDVAPEPPQEGATPTRLVEGFLQAMADPDGDYAIARQYLTTTAGEGWDPHTATVFEGTVDGDADSASINGVQVGRLDTAGRFTSGLASFHHDFTVTLEDGQWRIDTPPEGLLLSRYTFERYYSEVSVYFVSTIGSHVVPDPIHLPETLVTPTNIVQALLEGPSDSISRAVTNAIPVTVRLGMEPTSIDSQGVVTVDLAGLSSNLGDEARRRVGAQLLWSLTAIPRVTGLVVTRDGLPFTLPDSNVQGVLELSTVQGYQVLSRGIPSSDLFGIRDGVPGRVSSPFDPFRMVPTGTYADIAVSLDGASMALVDGARATLWIGARTGEMMAVETGLTSLREPQFVLGVLWVMGEDPGGATVMATIQRSGAVEKVTLDVPPGQRVEAFAVSPTRARIALVLSEGGQRRLGLATVLHSVPTRVVGWEELHLVTATNQLVRQPQSMRWSDETMLALLASSEGQRSVFIVHADGSSVEDLSPVGGEAAEIAALARMGGGPVAVRTTTDAVWRYDARTRWNRLSEAISAIAYGG